MRWQAVNEAKGVVGNLTFEKDLNDRGLQAVTFFLDGKPVLKARNGRYNEIHFEMPAGPKLVEQYFVEGKFMGVSSVSESFENEYEADERLREFKKASGFSNEDTLGLTVVKRMVEEGE